MSGFQNVSHKGSQTGMAVNIPYMNILESRTNWLFSASGRFFFCSLGSTVSFKWTIHYTFLDCHVLSILGSNLFGKQLFTQRIQSDELSCQRSGIHKTFSHQHDFTDQFEVRNHHSTRTKTHGKQNLSITSFLLWRSKHSSPIFSKMYQRRWWFVKSIKNEV